MLVPRHVEEALAQAGERSFGRALTFSPEGVATVSPRDDSYPVVLQWLVQCDLLMASVELCPLTNLNSPQVIHYCLELPALAPALAGMNFTGDDEDGKLFLTASIPKRAISAASVSLLTRRMLQVSSNLPKELWQEGYLDDEAIDGLLSISSSNEQYAIAPEGNTPPVDWNRRALSMLSEVIRSTGGDMPELPAIDEVELEFEGNGDPVTIGFLLDAGVGLLVASVDVQDIPADDDIAAWQTLLAMPNQDTDMAYLSLAVDPFFDRVVVSAPCYLASFDADDLSAQLTRLSRVAHNFTIPKHPDDSTMTTFPVHLSV